MNDNIPIYELSKFYDNLNYCIKCKREGRPPKDGLKLHTEMYQFIFKVCVKRIKYTNDLILDLYMSYINKIPVIISLEKVIAELSLINNVFAYPMRTTVVIKQNESIMRKRAAMMAILQKYLLFSDKESFLSRDVIKCIGLYIINLHPYPEIKDDSRLPD